MGLMNKNISPSQFATSVMPGGPAVKAGMGMAKKVIGALMPG